MGGNHGGIYIRCDSCGKTIGGEQVACQGLTWSHVGDLKSFAMREGWTGDLNRESNNDKCPECSEKK